MTITAPEATGLPPGVTLDYKESPAAAPRTLSVNEPEGVVTAIVSVTGVVDEVRDVIEPGAYTESLAKRRPKVVWAHKWTDPVGRVRQIEEWRPGDPRLPKLTKDGKPWPAEAGALVAEMQFNLTSDRGKRAFQDVAFFSESKEAEFSIGYQVPPGSATRSTAGVRRIRKMDLYEVSPVLFGAAPLSMTLALKDATAAPGDDPTDAADAGEAAPGTDDAADGRAVTEPGPDGGEAAADDGGAAAETDEPDEPDAEETEARLHADASTEVDWDATAAADPGEDGPQPAAEGEPEPENEPSGDSEQPEPAAAPEAKVALTAEELEAGAELMDSPEAKRRFTKADGNPNFGKGKGKDDAADAPADSAKNKGDGGAVSPEIANADDLKAAIAAVAKAKNPFMARLHVIARARKLGLVNLLPGDWHVKEKKGAGPDPDKLGVVSAALEAVAEALGTEVGALHDSLEVKRTAPQPSAPDAGVAMRIPASGTLLDTNGPLNPTTFTTSTSGAVALQWVDQMASWVEQRIEAKAKGEAGGGPGPQGGHDRNRGNAEELRKWYTAGEGAAKIRWGEGGDWQRCVDIAGKHMTPENARGYCNLRHRESTGMSTSQHAALDKAAHGKKSAELLTGWVPGAEVGPAAAYLPAAEVKAGGQLDGTYEERREAVRNAVTGALAGDGEWSRVTLLGTWEDRAVARRTRPGAEETYEVPYTAAPGGAVTVGEPVAVAVEMDVEPTFDATVLTALEDAELAVKAMTGFGTGLETKVGRVLSSSNVTKIKDAMSALLDVLAAAGVEIAPVNLTDEQKRRATEADQNQNAPEPTVAPDTTSAGAREAKSADQVILSHGELAEGLSLLADLTQPWVMEDKGGFDEGKHPRDPRGRFLTIGSHVKISGIIGGGEGKITANPGGGMLTVEDAAGHKRDIRAGYLHVIDKPKTGAPAAAAPSAPAAGKPGGGTATGLDKLTDVELVKVVNDKTRPAAERDAARKLTDERARQRVAAGSARRDAEARRNLDTAELAARNKPAPDSASAPAAKPRVQGAHSGPADAAAAASDAAWEKAKAAAPKFGGDQPVGRVRVKSDGPGRTYRLVYPNGTYGWMAEHDEPGGGRKTAYGKYRAATEAEAAGKAATGKPSAPSKPQTAREPNTVVPRKPPHNRQTARAELLETRKAAATAKARDDQAKLGKKVNNVQAPAGYSVYDRGEKNYEGKPVLHVHDAAGAHVGNIEPNDHRTQVMGRRGTASQNIAVGTNTVKGYRFVLPEKLRKELEGPRTAADSRMRSRLSANGQTKTTKKAAVEDLVRFVAMVREARKARGE